jgi:PTH1 family peptidyl-tRNA hydrolase
MWLLVGLGNPGRKYENNRHNIGFHVADELLRRHDLGSPRDKFGGQVASGFIQIGSNRHKVLLLKPMEFMNLSGYAVQRAAQYHDVEPDHIVVVHDEIDIDFGRLKLKSGGGHGGHNGLRSIVDQLGSKDFLRVRAGVGKPPHAGIRDAGDKRVANYVLSNFPSADADAHGELVTRAADAAESIVARGITASMNDFNTRGTAPKTEEA